MESRSRNGPEHLEIRRIAAEEIPVAARLSEDPARFRGAFLRLCEEGLSWPDWCFLAFERTRPVARVVYWRLPSVPGKLHVHALAAVSSRVGLPLLRESLAAMRKTGAREVECEDSTDDAEDRSLLLQAAGFRLLQEKRRYVRDSRTVRPRPHLAPRLTFRSLTEVGEEAFVEAIRRVTEDTLDRDDRATIEAQGPESAARQLFATLIDLDERPDWWRLAFDRDGELVGLVVPQRFTEETGALNYVGVSPEMRGHGYGEDLIAEGTRVLEEQGVRRIIGDIDARNEPLVRALGRAGYVETKTFRIWRAEI